MTLCLMRGGSEFVDWKSTFLSVIPAQAGIQVFFGLAELPKMDASLRRHDKSSLRLKARDFNHPEIDIKLCFFDTYAAVFDGVSHYTRPRVRTDRGAWRVNPPSFNR